MPQRSKETKLKQTIITLKKASFFLWVKISLLQQLNVVAYKISQIKKENGILVDKLLSEALCKTEDKKLFLHSLVCAKQK